LDAEKAKAGWDYRYSGKCRQLTDTGKRRYEAEGRKPTVRLKVTGDTIVVPDLIKGYVEFKAETMDDFIIVRSNGTPLYNFTSTIDDSLMQITHVIRGEDHLSNTPKQILIYQALGFEVPKFAHAPTVLDKEGKKLSKRRHGELVAIDYYQKSGYLPEAMVNFLVRLGWSFDDKEEMFTVDELIEKFAIGRVGKSASIFDIQKLQWLNREYIMKHNVHERTDLVVPFLRKAGLLNDSGDNPLDHPLLRGTDAEKRIWLEKMVEAIGDRMTTLADIETHSSFFFADELEYDEKAVQKSLKKDFVPGMLQDLKSIFVNLEPFDENAIEAKIREYAERSGLGGKVMLPTRVAITGKSTGPGLFESLALLGRDKVLQRIDKAMGLL
jgi:glutamyl-tRNA synthetase